MTQQVAERKSTFTLAQEGDPEAIAFLINQVIAKKGITAIAKRKENWLHIVLVSDEVPEKDACIRFIKDGMTRLQAKSINSVRVYGRKSGHKWPSWTEALDLASLPHFPPVPPQPPQPTTRPPKKKRKPAKLATKYKKRIRLLLLGGITWVMVAALGVVVSYQMNSPNRSNREQLSDPVREFDPNSSEQTKPTQKPVAVAPKVPENAAKSIISIKAVGDIVPGSNFPNNRLPSNKQVLFQNVKPYLQGADILFGNFESTLTNYPRTAKDTSRPMVHAFRTPPEYAKLFKEVGFDVMSVANNHSLDFTLTGFEDTMKNLEKVGVKPVGKKNQILYTNVKNNKVAFIGFSHLAMHNSVNDIPGAKALVLEAKKKADIVVISFHGGAEGTSAMRVKNRQENFYGENRGNLVLFSRTLIDNGADLVLGHGPHVPRAMELYKGKLIAYSLGNFVGYRSLSTVGALGKSLILEVKLNPQGDFVAGKIIPVKLDRVGIPSLDKTFNSVQIIRNLIKGDFPSTPLKIDNTGQILKE